MDRNTGRRHGLSSHMCTDSSATERQYCTRDYKGRVLTLECSPSYRLGKDMGSRVVPHGSSTKVITLDLTRRRGLGGVGSEQEIPSTSTQRDFGHERGKQVVTGGGTAQSTSLSSVSQRRTD